MEDVTAAARLVFRRKGFKRTQVADIASEVGISPAALYRHVESKDALFHLCFLPEPPDVSSFLATPEPGTTLLAIKAALGRAMPSSNLRAALRTSTDDAVAELAGIVEEQYRSVQEHWELLALVEASAQDLPELQDAYFRKGRRRITRDLTRYLERRGEEGALRVVDDPELVAVQIREACAWFAWHRRGDADADLDDDRALAAIIDTYVHALVP
jgi:AcrR family transcriptional regulator